MSETEQQGSGAQHAAVLLMTLGENEASDVLRHMTPKEVQRLGLAMAALKDVSKEQAETVLNVFVTAVEEQTSLAIGTQDYIRKVLVNAFGEARAGALIERILTGDDSDGLESLKWMTPEAIAAMIAPEHPQIIAIVLAYLDDEQAGAVMLLLPDELRASVLMRVANLDDIQQTALAEIENLIASSADSVDVGRPAKVGGDKAAADILNAMAGKSGEVVLAEINEQDEELGVRIQEMMFVFESLLLVDDRGIQALLREVSNSVLSVALKGAEPALQDKIFNNMSKRAATLMREDMEAGGPVKLSEVEAAQKEIIASVRAMAESGDINIGGGDDYV